MVLAASCEFDKRLNSEIVERPSDNEEIPEVIISGNCFAVAGVVCLQATTELS